MVEHALSWMDYRLSREQVEAIYDMSLSEDKRHLETIGLTDLPKEKNEAFAQINRHISGLLNGDDENISKVAIKKIADEKVNFDPISLKMMRSTGIDAAIAFYVAKFLSQRLPFAAFKITKGSARGASLELHISPKEHTIICSPITNDVFWQYKDTLYIKRPMPHSMCLAMEGRPLKDVVDHPILTPLDLKILSVERTKSATLLNTSYIPCVMRSHDLTLENTRPVDLQPERKAENRPAMKSHF